MVILVIAFLATHKSLFIARIWRMIDLFIINCQWLTDLHIFPIKALLLTFHCPGDDGCESLEIMIRYDRIWLGIPFHPGFTVCQCWSNTRYCPRLVTSHPPSHCILKSSYDNSSENTWSLLWKGGISWQPALVQYLVLLSIDPQAVVSENC